MQLYYKLLVQHRDSMMQVRILSFQYITVSYQYAQTSFIIMSNKGQYALVWTNSYPYTHLLASISSLKYFQKKVQTGLEPHTFCIPSAELTTTLWESVFNAQGIEKLLAMYIYVANT